MTGAGVPHPTLRHRELRVQVYCQLHMYRRPHVYRRAVRGMRQRAHPLESTPLLRDTRRYKPQYQAGHRMKGGLLGRGPALYRQLMRTVLQYKVVKRGQGAPLYGRLKGANPQDGHTRRFPRGSAPPTLQTLIGFRGRGQTGLQLGSPGTRARPRPQRPRKTLPRLRYWAAVRRSPTSVGTLGGEGERFCETRGGREATRDRPLGWSPGERSAVPRGRPAWRSCRRRLRAVQLTCAT